ncbi:MAG: ACP S-malonyltransferase [Deltaproteobacteria bacterium]
MITFVFPGQGSQYVGMCQELYNKFAAARRTFEEASEVLGFDLARLCFEDSSREQLNLTVNAQPAILTASVAALRVFEEETDIRPDFVAGHSLGEYTALVASKALNFMDAVWVVRKRGEFTQGAVPVGVGSMAAVLGLEKEQVEGICSEASSGDEFVGPANFNAPGQTVISGTKRAVEKAGELARAIGAKRVVLLEISAPFHCKLMAPAAEKLAQVLDKIKFSDFSIPIVSNLDAKINLDPSKIKEILIEQVKSPVRWYESMKTLCDEGATKFFEIGPGNVLSGLIRRTISNAFVKNFEKTSHLESLKENEVQR